MIEKIKNLLTQSNVTKIIYVDDLFSLENCYESAKAKLRVLLERDDFKHLDFLSGEKEIAIEEFDSWWKKASNEEKRTCVFEKIKIDVDEMNILSCLNTLKEKGFEISFMAPNDFSDEYITELKGQLSEERHGLLLIDKELDGFGHDGTYLLNKVDSEQYLHCGLFSGKFNIEDEINQWKEMGFSATVYPVSKKRIMEEPQKRILEGFRNILWLNHIFKMKEHSKGILKKGCEATIRNLEQIDPASFDYAVIKRSHEEGCWEFITINRILMVMLENEIQSEVLKEEKFPCIQKDFTALRVSSTYPVDFQLDDSWLKQFRQKEVYTNGNYINKTFSPVANGDIFSMNGKEYILLCQPCSLSIRKDGRRARSLNSAYLLEIKKGEKSKSSSEIFDDPTTKKYVDFAAALTCNLSVMDLVSFNGNGIANINTSIDSTKLTIRDLLQPNMLKRYDAIKKEMSKYLCLYQTCLVREAKDAKAALDYYTKSCFLTIPEIKDASTITFNISRTQRYNELLAQVLCSKLMNYMARIALPNDLSKE